MSDVEPAGYAELLAQAKAQIQAARTRAALAVNAELIGLYWRLGQLILARQREAGWGAKVVDRLSADLRAEFPGMRGLSVSNLKYMRRFAEAWPDGPIGQRVVDQLPWGHNIELLSGLSDSADRLWYAQQALAHGWSRDVLGIQIMSKLHLRAGSASTNFAATLPPAESDLVRQLIKDPYHLEFLDVVEEASERDVERALIAQVERFLLELGQGFAFVGRQYPLTVGGEDFFVDLLFFHIPTKRYIVLELKRRRFTPEAVGKLNFYVNVIDDVLRGDGENPTIGLLLCRTRNEVVVRYALSGIAAPMAVAGYRLAELPPEARASLPAEDDLLGAIDTVAEENDGRLRQLAMAGSMRQRGKSSWQLRVLAGRDELTGRKLYVSKTFRGGRRDAERELARLVTQVEEGTRTARSGTVAELCEKWFEFASPGLSPAVAAEYRRLLDRRILPRWGTTSVRRLRTAELDAWYAQLRRSGGVSGGELSPNSVNRVHSVLRRALAQAVKWGWITVNPAAAASPPRVRREALEVPSPDDVGQLIAASAKVNRGLPVFLRLAATTGARRGELCALRWRDVDLDRGVLHISGAVVEVKRQLIEKGTKTHAERRITLDEGSVRVLSTYRAEVEDALAFAGATLSPDAFVFSHHPGGLKPWRLNYATLAFIRLARREGLEGVRLHDLRHFAATTMLVGGVDVRTAAGRLGHAQSSTTLDIYAYFVRAADERAASAIGAALDRTARGATESSPPPSDR